MIFVACSGFPLPMSRYWGLFGAVEIADTELGIPGSGTVRRWVRESHDGYGFTALAPAAIAASGFRRTNENKELVKAMGEIAGTLNAHAVVFRAEADFKPTKATKAALKTFVGWAASSVPAIVLDLPGWKADQVAAAVGKKKKLAIAYDPLNEKPVKGGDLAYLRLPGPAGKRSRYDVASVDAIAEHVAALAHDTVFCVFRNIDMQANATSLLKKLESG